MEKSSVGSELSRELRARATSAKKLMTLTHHNSSPGGGAAQQSLAATLSIKELQQTMEAAQEQLRPFCMSETPQEHFGSALLYLLHVCYRPLLERWAPASWKGFYVELARLGGPSGVLTLLTIARIDGDGTGHIDEAELKEFDLVARKLITDTCDALNMSAVVASLLFGACFQSAIGRPTPLVPSEATVEAFGEDVADMLHWVAYSTMTSISVLCLIVIMYAFGSRMELQNVLPSTQARLFYLCEVNPMNAVTAISMLCMLLFVVLIIFAGLLASPRQGFFTLISVPMVGLLANPLWHGMRNGPVRLRLEARAFLGIVNKRDDLVCYRRNANATNSRLKAYLATYQDLTRGELPPASFVGVVQRARHAAQAHRRGEEGEVHHLGPSVALGVAPIQAMGQAAQGSDRMPSARPPRRSHEMTISTPLPSDSSAVSSTERPNERSTMTATPALGRAAPPSAAAIGPTPNAAADPASAAAAATAAASEGLDVVPTWSEEDPLDGAPALAGSPADAPAGASAAIL